MKLVRSRIVLFVIIASFIVFGAMGMAFSGSNLNAVQEELRTYYRNFIDASAKYGADSPEAKAWFDKYSALASEFSKKAGSGAAIDSESGGSAAAGAGSSGTNPGFFKKVTYQFLEKLKALLDSDQIPSHMNDFALAEMNFVSGNYKDALTLYEMAQRKGELAGVYFYQSIYWQGRCYLEMAKAEPDRAKQIDLYKKAQQKYLNVSMNLLGKKNPNAQEQMYLKDSTSLVLQINKYLAFAGSTPNTSYPATPNVNSSFEDKSWKTTLRYDYLVSDQAYVDVNSMSRDQIQSFLKSKNSVLSRPVDGKYPADMIYAAAKEFGISPKVILARLQTEQSLVTVKTATQKQLDWALGCGAYDSGNWDSKYKGLENQIRFGAKTMRTHYNKGLTMIAQKGSINKTIDGENINIKNAATYANYMYTPHKHGGKLFRSCYLTFFGN